MRGAWLPCLLGLLATVAVPSCAARAGRKATAGAAEQIRRESKKVEAREPGVYGERITRGAVKGALEGLDDRALRQRLIRLIDLTVRTAVRAGVASLGSLAQAQGHGGRAAGASAAPDDPPLLVAGTGRRDGHEDPTPIAALTRGASREMTRAVSEEVTRQLGADGRGPLGRALAGTSGQVAASIVAGARSEQALFPECTGAERAACIEQRVQDLGRVAGRGVVSGAREALGPWPLILAFIAGVLLTLLVGWMLSVVRLQRALVQRKA